MTTSRVRFILLGWLGALLVIVFASVQAIVEPLGRATAAEIALVIGFGFGFMTVGSILVARRPTEPVSRISLAIGILTMTATALNSLSIILVGLNGPTPALAVIAQVVTAMLWTVALVVWGFLLVRFPAGRGTDRLTATADFLLVVALVGSVLGVFAPGEIIVAGQPSGMNPIGFDALDASILGPIQGVGLLAFLGGLFLGVVVLVRRYRGAGRVVRTQIRWFGAAAALPVLLIPVLLTVDSFYTLWFALSGALPAAIGIAILRYRLYDIDRIISRTLAYAVVTTLLAAVFLASNLLLQSAVASATGEGTIAVAGSTLLVAALFVPIRGRVQAPLDRQFDRAHVDAAKVVQSFGDRAREEVDLVRLNDAVVTSAREAVAPASASIWLRPVH